MIDYDREADRYDISRGGEARATAAAAAIEPLLPTGARLLLDVACGTGVVTARLRRPHRTVIGIDRSAGMITKAAGRMPGRLALADAAALPIGSGQVDAVLMIWLLHLVAEADRMIAEAARVLGPTGLLLTTVDKNEAPFLVAGDIAELTAPLRRRRADARTDGHDRVLTEAARHGLRPVAETTFAGPGQGRTPRQWIERIRADVIPWADSTESADLCRALAALPGQDEPRADPVYRLVALAR